MRRCVLERNGRRMQFECPNDLTYLRAEGTIRKEPGTIAWIDGFEEGSRFWDIGANIGSFTIYAAVMRGCKVTAFEPSAENYLVLNRNIVVNHMDRKVRALAAAVDERSSIAEMHMRESLPGAALHTFGTDIDYTGNSFKAAYFQGAIGLSIDDACEVFGLPVPHYIKIDVDGLERAVVAGGVKTFAQSDCRSVLVELDLNDASEVAHISGILEGCGLTRDDSVAGNVGRDHGKVLVYNMIFRRPS
uniref:Methyltransferase FkbM family n=1 Tax=Rhodopseudomonas palustris (strain BisA53) TaxID=316055 RepID=Q07L68_RHOP5